MMPMQVNTKVSMGQTNNELIGAYIPVLHRGYLELFEQYPDAEIGVLDSDVLTAFDDTRKEVRALSPEIAVRAIGGLNRSARLLSSKAVYEAFNNPEQHLILPDDVISHDLLKQHVHHLAKVSLEPVFLRWDRDNVSVNQEVVADRIITDKDIPIRILNALSNERQGSTNWWRHVSAIVTRNDTMLAIAHNQTLPTDYTSYIESDPRITSSRGAGIETSLDIHAESNAIAQLAKRGVALEGAEIYVSTFPCPTCAKLIAQSGIRTCYFVEGYAILDGYRVLKSADVEIVKINAKLEDDIVSRALPYPKNPN